MVEGLAHQWQSDMQEGDITALPPIFPTRGEFREQCAYRALSGQYQIYLIDYKNRWEFQRLSYRVDRLKPSKQARFTKRQKL
jgi:hypothetical protein